MRLVFVELGPRIGTYGDFTDDDDGCRPAEVSRSMSHCVIG